MTRPDGWYADPTGRHELRYWGKGEWSAAVSDRNVMGSDRLDGQPPPPAGPSAAEGGDGAAAPPQPQPASSTISVAPAATAAPAGAPAPPLDVTAAAAPAATAAPPPGAPGAAPAATTPGGAAPPPGAPGVGAPAAPGGSGGGAPSPYQAGYQAPLPPGAAAGAGTSTYGRSGERLRTGVPGPLAFASVLYGAPAVFSILYGLLLFAFAAIVNDADAELSNSGDLSLEGATGAAAVAGLVMLAFGIAYLATAVGLAMATPWSRLLAVVLAGVQVLGVLVLAFNGDAPASLVALAYPVVSVLLVYTTSASAAFAKRPITVSEIEQPDR